MTDIFSAKRYHKWPKSIEHLNLFTVTVRSAYLEACDSPKQAFYRIWIEDSDGKITVVKESGIKGRVLDRRSWICADRRESENAYQRRIEQKTDPQRRIHHGMRPSRQKPASSDVGFMLSQNELSKFLNIY